MAILLPKTESGKYTLGGIIVANSAYTGFLERTFKLHENNTTVRREVVAGITTFMTMAYILFVNPSILQEAGMPFNAVFFATAFSAIVATVLMGLNANYPIALAPGMGLNAYFTYSVVLGMGVPWQTALGAVFISGMLMVLLTATRVREMIIDSAPETLKSAIGAGIGLFIALVGLNSAGIVVADPATLVTLGSFGNPSVILACIGLILTGVLLVLKVRGAILWGILATTVIGMPMGVTPIPDGIIRWPAFSEWSPILFKLDIPGALRLGAFEIIFAFLFVDIFDTVGTLIGVCKQGGLLDKDGKLERAREALVSDGVGTVVGALFGTSTVTSYVESAAGVAAGGRTGLTAVTVAGCFVLSLFFLPIVAVVPAAATAPALIIVGSLMIKQAVDINWEDISDALPAFVTMVAMPFTYSIANGISLGYILYPLIKVLTGKGKEVHWLVYVLGGLFIIRYIYLAL